MNRQTIIIHHSLATALQSFNKGLHLDFTPSIVIVRGVEYGEGAGATDLHGIIAPWSNSPIATFIDDTNNGYSSNPSTTFNLYNPGMLVNGDITFQVRRLNNNTSASTATGKISLTLEFVEEEQKTPSINFDMKPLMNLIAERIPVNAFSREISFGMGMTGGLLCDTRNAFDQVNPIPDVNPEVKPEVKPEEVVEKEQEGEGKGDFKKIESQLNKRFNDIKGKADLLREGYNETTPNKSLIAINRNIAVLLQNISAFIKKIDKFKLLLQKDNKPVEGVNVFMRRIQKLREDVLAYMKLNIDRQKELRKQLN